MMKRLKFLNLIETAAPDFRFFIEINRDYSGKEGYLKRKDTSVPFQTLFNLLQALAFQLSALMSIFAP